MYFTFIIRCDIIKLDKRSWLFMNMIKITKRVHDKFSELSYPGAPEPIVLTFHNGLVKYNDYEGLKKADIVINEIAKRLGNLITSLSTGYQEQTFLSKRDFKDLKDIENQTEEDYINDWLPLANFLTIAKVIASKSIKDNKVYFAHYDFEENCFFYDCFDNFNDYEEKLKELI